MASVNGTFQPISPFSSSYNTKTSSTSSSAGCTGAFNARTGATSIDVGNYTGIHKFTYTDNVNNTSYTEWRNNTYEGMFAFCSNVQTITNLNRNATGSLSNAFRACYNLTTSPILPKYATNFCNTFWSCNKLTSGPTLPNGIQQTTYAFYQCTNMVTPPPYIPSSVQSADYCFRECYNLKTPPAILNGVISLHDTFSYCRNLTYAPVIPNSVVNLQRTFYNCANLNAQTIILPTSPYLNSDHILGENIAFSRLNSINKDHATSLSGLFAGCNTGFRVTRATYGNNVDNIVNLESCFSMCSNLSSVSYIPSNVTNLVKAFYADRNLTSFSATIPNGVTSLKATFMTCNRLYTDPIIPNSVTDLTQTFDGCNNLATVNIPDSVTTMVGTFSWRSMGKSMNVYIHAKEVVDATNCFFAGMTNTHYIYLPFTYQNNAHTTTYNTFENAGYSINTTNSYFRIGDSTGKFGVSYIGKYSSVNNTTTAFKVKDQAGNIILNCSTNHEVSDKAIFDFANVTTLCITNLIEGDPETTGLGCSSCVVNGASTVTYTNTTSGYISQVNITSPNLISRISLNFQRGSLNTSCCITGDTPVNYYDGSTKPAEEVQKGDKLLGYNQQTETFVEVDVLETIARTLTTETVEIITENHRIEVTTDHPLLTDQGWAVYDINTKNYSELEKIQLDTSLKLLTSDGTYENIINISHKLLMKPIITYTFDVTDDADTYVAAGLISHNAPDPCSGGKD